MSARDVSSLPAHVLVSLLDQALQVQVGSRARNEGEYLNKIVISALSVSLLERIEKHSELVLGLGSLSHPTTSKVVFPMAHRRSVFGVRVLRFS